MSSARLERLPLRTVSFTKALRSARSASSRRLQGRRESIADAPWRTRNQLELVVVEYLGWFNNARLHESLGDIPPAEFEALYAVQVETSTETAIII